MQATAHEPLLLKGSLEHPIRKKTAKSGTMLDFRAISIRLFLIKAHHSFVRDRFRLLVGSCLFNFQYGGAKNRSHLMAAALIRWTVAAAIKSGKACQVFLGDVMSAYYRVLHVLLVPQLFSAQCLGDILDQSDIPIAFHEPILGMLREPGAVAAHSHDPHLLAMMQEALTSTWFATRQGRHVVEPKSGTGPGDPLADTLYTFGVAPVYQVVDGWLRQESKHLQFGTLDATLVEALDLDPNGSSQCPTQALYCDDDAIVAVMDAGPGPCTGAVGSASLC